MKRSHKKTHHFQDRRHLYLNSPEIQAKARAEIRATLNTDRPFAVGYCACGLRLSVADTDGECLECREERQMLEIK